MKCTIDKPLNSKRSFFLGFFPDRRVKVASRLSIWLSSPMIAHYIGPKVGNILIVKTKKTR